VFAEVGGESYKNDKTPFMFRRFVSSDTVAIELYKSGVKIADLNDNTLGEFTNGFASGNSEQQTYVAFLLYWEDVFAAYGGGEYQIKAQLSTIGVATTYESALFRLMGYSDLAADGTVKIESVQNGNIMSSLFDFAGLEWYQSIRVRGNFYEDSEGFEKIDYKTQNHKKQQVQDKVIENWTLEADMLPRTVSEFLTKNAILSNTFTVTDYNIMNESILRGIEVAPESIEKTRFSNNRNSNYIIKFTSREDNIIKRNF
jgi:ribosomal protein S19